MRLNALHNCKNPYQGDEPRILCVCSAGLLRSPTLAYVLSKGNNVRAAGVHDYALVQVDEVLIKWADIVICVEKEYEDIIRDKYPHPIEDKPIISLSIPDIFPFKDKKLIRIIKKQLREQGLLDG